MASPVAPLRLVSDPPLDGPAERHAASILVVDDVEANRLLLRTYLLAKGYDVREASDGEHALDLIRETPPDLVLLDVMMPGLTGYDVCRELREMPNGQLVPVIMQTSLEGVEEKTRAADAGADDFISKPIDGTELLIRVRSLLRIKRLTDALDGAANTILALARALEARDPYTRGHSQRVGMYAGRLAAAAGFGAHDHDALHTAGLLHDVGKIGVCEGTLGHRGQLDEAQWAEIRRHPVVGEEICKPLKSVAGQLSSIRHHHERWDGRGYPDELRGDDIPLGARIVSVCDAWDAMTSNRVYRPGMAPERASEILHEGRGSQWDADLVELFLEHLDSITSRE